MKIKKGPRLKSSHVNPRKSYTKETQAVQLKFKGEEMSKYKGLAIRSKKTKRVFRVLDQRGFPETELLVKLIHSPQEEQPHVHEPFWLDHFEWEEVSHQELSALPLTEP